MFLACNHISVLISVGKCPNDNDLYTDCDLSINDNDQYYSLGSDLH